MASVKVELVGEVGDYCDGLRGGGCVGQGGGGKKWLCSGYTQKEVLLMDWVLGMREEESRISPKVWLRQMNWKNRKVAH